MKKRTIMAIMIGFMLLSLVLNWRLKENMLQGYWVGAESGGNTPLGLHVEKKELHWKDASGLRSTGWYITKDAGLAKLALTSKEDTVTFGMVLHQFDTLFLFTPPASGDSAKGKTYTLHRAKVEEWRTLQVGAHE